MQNPHVYTSGMVATMLGINRDRLMYAFVAGCPKPQVFACRRCYTPEDIQKIYEWFVGRGRIVNRPQILDEIGHTSTT
ncbi:MAG: hypothetical protein LUE17_15505 [Planctomycetaceae bacterium]|nr:hypothetical protein [Planctomycetaceae bacterium]